MAAPEDSPEHESFRIEMCDLKLLGGEGACRYFLSKITGVDQFALWDDEFVENVREYLASETNGAASQFQIDAHAVQFVVPFLKRAFEDSRRSASSILTKQDRAVELLLRNPRWTDQQIAASVPTTTKQLQRFTNYTALKVHRDRNNE